MSVWHTLPDYSAKARRREDVCKAKPLRVLRQLSQERRKACGASRPLRACAPSRNHIARRPKQRRQLTAARLQPGWTLTRPHKLGLALAAGIFAADQALKWLMIGPLALRAVQSIEIVPIFRLTWTENYGVSLGLLTADTEWQRWLLVALTAAIAVVVLVWMLREKLTGDVLALGLVLGGALGNILDRARFGYVVDFADLHFGEFRPFLIFNLADAAITIGVLIILVRSFLFREKKPSTPKELPES